MHVHPPHSLHELELAQGLARAAVHPHHLPKGAGDRAARMFVTVSRQAGSGAKPFARELVRRLNETPEANWSAWDQELVEKVSAEHHIQSALVEFMENRRHTWFQDFLEGLSSDTKSHPDELKVYRRVATAIRALAAAGHAVIVGRGGAFITAGLPGGIHIRLVAPLANRIVHYARDHGVSEKEAAAAVAGIDRARDAFYRRYWPGRPLASESFTMTLNTAQLAVDEIVEGVVALIHTRERHAGARPAPATTTGGVPHANPELDRSGAV